MTARTLLAAATLALFGAASAWVGQGDDPAVAHARALVARMTTAEKVAQLQSGAPAIPRLGVPAYDWWGEGLHGLARGG